jgi:hypothetical protein
VWAREMAWKTDCSPGVRTPRPSERPTASKPEIV